MQDKAWATAGTGTVNSVIMQPFKSSAIAHTGTGDPVVILDKTEFTTAEILLLQEEQITLSFSLEKL